MAVKYYSIRNFIQLEEITVQYKKMQEIIANGLIKVLGPIIIKEFIKYQVLITKVKAAKKPSKNRYKKR